MNLLVTQALQVGACFVVLACQAPGPVESRLPRRDKNVNAAVGARSSEASSGGSKLGSAVPPGSGGGPAAEPPREVVVVTPTDSSAPSPESKQALPPPLVVPPLLDEANRPLPQTDEQPSRTSPSFEGRMQLLVRAIVNDAPEVALPAFFPVLAYAQVKAIERPERDWEKRLVTAFRRNIHEYHRKLGANSATFRFARLEMNEQQVKWMKPGSEGNRVGYYRVLRSKLVLTSDAGAERSLEVTSLISWRGEWYVVHLNGFQ